MPITYETIPIPEYGWKKKYTEGNRIRMKGVGDRISKLPDNLIHKILSFTSIKEAIETSDLSSRWRYIWTSLPYLNFSSEDFHTLPEFSEFVTNVLSRRNNEIDVSSITLTFHGKASQVFVKRIMDYGFSHNIEQLKVTCLMEEKTEFPLSFLRSQSLKHLTLVGVTCGQFSHPFTLTSSWELPSLATLHLIRVTFADDEYISLFSKCVNLKNLLFDHCTRTEPNVLRIFHPRLSNLTLEGCFAKFVNVVTPQLEKLSITAYPASGKHLIFAPLLSSLRLHTSQLSDIVTDGFPLLEKVDFISNPSYKHEAAFDIVCLLQQLRSVKFLRLNFEIVEVLSSFVELISHLPSPFANLKSLHIYPQFLNTPRHVEMSTTVKNYLLDASPSATFTMVSRQEMIVEDVAKDARDSMERLKVMLEREKAKMEQVHAQIESAEPKTKEQRDFEEKMAEVETYWEDLSVPWKKWDPRTRAIVYRLNGIERLLKLLPTSHRAKMKPQLSNLREEVYTTMRNMVNCLKIQRDNKPSPIQS